MPVGAYTKEEIRQIAEEAGLPVAQKKDSQEICFVPDNDYAGFIETSTGEKIPKGNYVLEDGTVIGQHQGIIHYTIGQRKGVPDNDYAGFIETSTGEKIPKGNYVLEDGTVIGQHQGIIHYTIGQRKGLNLSMGHPVFVTEIRPHSNEVVIGENEDLFVNSLVCDRVNYMAISGLDREMRLNAKIRYNHPGAECTVKPMEDEDLFVNSLVCDRVNYMAISGLDREMRLNAKIRYNHPGAECTVKPMEDGKVLVVFDRQSAGWTGKCV